MKSMRRYFRRRVVIAAVCCFALTGLAATARAEKLLDYVGDGTGFAVYLHRVPDWLDQPDSLPLLLRLKMLSPVRGWMEGPDYRQLRNRLSGLEKQLRMPVRKALQSVIGSELLLAVDPQAPGGPAGVLLTAPRNRSDVQFVLDVLQQFDGAKVRETDDGYFERVVNNGKSVFYVLDDGLFAISDREELIRQISHLRTSGQPHPRALSETSEWRRAAGSISPETLISIYFRPSLWKPIEHMEFNTPGFGPILREMASAESLILGVDDQDGLHAELNVLPGSQGFSPRFASTAGKWSASPQLWEHVPANMLMSVVVQADSELLSQWVDSSLPDTSEFRGLRSVLQGLLLDHDPVRDVLPQFGPEAGVYVVRSEETESVPIGAMIVASYHNDGDETLRAGIENLARTGLRLAASQWSPRDSSGDLLHTDRVQGGTLYWLDQTPLGKPAVYVGASRVWLASSPELIRHELERRENAPAIPEAIDTERLADMQQVVYLDVRGVRRLLTDRGDDLLRFLRVPESEMPQSREKLEGIKEFLRLCDALYAGVELKPDMLRIRAGLQISAE